MALISQLSFSSSNIHFYEHIYLHDLYVKPDLLRRLSSMLKLVNNPLDAIQPHLQNIHLRSITEPHEMMARTIKQITSLTRVQIEEDTRDNDDSLLKTGLEEVQSVGDRWWETLEIEPEVEGGVGDGFDVETHSAETLDNVVSLVAEMALESFHFCEDLVGF